MRPLVSAGSSRASQATSRPSEERQLLSGATRAAAFQRHEEVGIDEEERRNASSRLDTQFSEAKSTGCWRDWAADSHRSQSVASRGWSSPRIQGAPLTTLAATPELAQAADSP